MGTVADRELPFSCATGCGSRLVTCRPHFDFVLVLIGALLTATTGRTALAACSTERVGQWGGASKTLAVQGDFAYVGIGAKLVVVDLSDPQEPTLVGSLLLNGVAQDIAVSVQHVYVCTDGLSMEIIDIFNPSQPTRVGEYVTVLAPARVVLQGQYAFVLSDNIGLQVVDVSTPQAPVLAGQFNMCCPTEMAIAGSYAYVRSDFQTILLDISEPTAPALVSTVNLGGAMRMAAAGNLLYVLTDSGAGFRVYGISNPASPIFLGYELVPSPQALVVVGNVVYLATYSGLVVLDVSDPANPEIVGESNGPEGLTDVALHEAQVVVTQQSGAVQVVDVSDPVSPQLEGQFRENARPRTVAISGTHAYLAGSVCAPALQVLDIAEPTVPTLAGESLEMSEWGGNDLTIRDSIAYLAVPDDALLIYDISAAGLPTLLADFDAVLNVSNVAVEDTTAYILNGGFQVVDVTDPSAPSLLGQLYHGLLNSAEGVASHENGAYVIVPFGVSSVIDVSKPSSPQIVGPFPVSNYAVDIEVSAARAYVLDLDFGLLVYELNNPTSPFLLTMPTGPFDWNSEWNVTIHGSFAYLAGGGLTLVDVSDPAAPIVIDQLYAPGFGTDADVLGSYAYVASNDSGLNIFRTCIPADANCDGRMDGLDVTAFSQAVLDPDAYQSTHPFCNFSNADVNQDDEVNEADIAPFVERILAH